MTHAAQTAPQARQPQPLSHDKLNAVIEQTRQLFVVNNPAYVWRVNSLGMGEHHNYIPCWYIVDSEGNILDGGYSSGNNCRSGHANFPRKKDAMAVAKGLQWGFANLDKLSVDSARYSYVKGWEESCPYPNSYDMDNDPRGLYDAGVTDAFNIAKGKRAFARRAAPITGVRKYAVK